MKVHIRAAYRVRCELRYGRTLVPVGSSGRDQSALYAGKGIPARQKDRFLRSSCADNFQTKAKRAATGLSAATPTHWNAVWTGASEDIKRKPVYFRLYFTVDTDIVGGCLYICGLGYHRKPIHSTAPKLDPSVLDPAHSDYTY